MGQDHDSDLNTGLTRYAFFTRLTIFEVTCIFNLEEALILYLLFI